MKDKPWTKIKTKRVVNASPWDGGDHPALLLRPEYFKGVEKSTAQDTIKQNG